MIPRLKTAPVTNTLYLDFLQVLRKSGFKGDLRSDYADRTVQATDNSIYQIAPQSVVYPADTADLVLLCQLANENRFRKVVLTPRGGGTGTNAQALTDGIAVDVSKHMNRILEINAAEGWVRVQCGVVKDQLNAALTEHNLFFAPELSTSDRATIGGMINTDASGQGSCCYGKTRDHVLELNTVLLDGSVLVSRPLEQSEFQAIINRDDRSAHVHRVVDGIQQQFAQEIADTFPALNRCMTGYDLAHIRNAHGRFNLNSVLCGSEGTLGFTAEAKLNVLPIPPCTALVLVQYADFQDSLRDARELMQASPTSIETIDSKVLNLARQDFIWTRVEAFFPDDGKRVEGINFVEFTAESEEALSRKIAGLESLLNTVGPGEARLGYALARGRDAADRLWAMRKRAVGLLGNAQGEARPVPFVEDTAVPPEYLANFIREFREILDSYQLQYGMFGHVDAGVLHVRPALDLKDPQQEAIAWEISDRVADLTLQYGGVLWGEHGKGVRSQYAPKFFGSLYPQLQRIKSAFDPFNQLNPGKIATPDNSLELLKISEVPTRGQRDRNISAINWREFQEAVYCNGNASCFNWNPKDTMCPSWKGTRERIHSPKGRAALIRQWLTLLSERKSDPADILRGEAGDSVLLWPRKLWNSLLRKLGQKDFSHEVYQAMAGCLACKSCTGQCPIKVDVPEFRSKFLAAYHTRYLRPLKDCLVGSLEVLLPLAAKFPRAYNYAMRLGWVVFLLRRLVDFVDAPRLTRIQLRPQQFPVANVENINTLSEAERRKIVVIVQDAFTRYFETPLVMDVFRLVERLGFKPMLAPYMANGKPLHVHGFLRSFRNSAGKNAKMLNALAKSGAELVGIDPAMTLTYRSEYAKYLDGPPPPVALLQEWLGANLTALRNIETRGEPQTYRLLPHCMETSNAAETLTLWQQAFAATGHTLDIAPVGCCGMSGTYGHEARNRETSTKIYNLSWRGEVARHADCSMLMATGYSCRSQVKREHTVPLPHPAQVLLKVLNGESGQGSSSAMRHLGA